MKKVKIDWEAGRGPGFCYPSTALKFSWLTTPVKGVYPQVSSWHSCRETFAGEIVRLARNSWMNTRKINVRRMRYLVIHRNKAAYVKDTDEWVKRGKKILNVFEKHMGWSLSKMYAVDWEKNDGLATKLYVVSASAKWLRAPQLLSLHLLLLRCGKFKQFDALKTLDDLPSVASALRRGRQNSSDANRVKSDQASWRKIADNVDYLFFSRKMKTLFTQNEGHHGIQALVRNQGGDVETRRRFKEIKQGKGK